MEGSPLSRAKIAQEKLVEKNTPFLSICVETKNANLIILSEGEDQLGTLAVSLPQTRKMVGPPLSSILLGDRNVIIARALAERLAEKMQKITLVSVFTKTFDEREVAPIFRKLLEKTIRPEEDKS